jgi:pyridoxamine 5'-phosphate oxidase
MTDPLYAQALATFAGLLEEATATGMADPNAMTVATVDARGMPSARTVLLKEFDARGFVFYTHYDSAKGRDLQAHPKAALLFLWRHLREAGVQVRVQGAVERVDAQESDAYFASRPRQSQLGAWASQQSWPLESREAFNARLAQMEQRFADGPVPRPPGWGGFRVIPETFEFWYGAGFRLHERWSYSRDGQGRWSKCMLNP